MRRGNISSVPTSPGIATGLARGGNASRCQHRIDGTRLLQRHEAMTKFGDYGRGGVVRPALSAEESKARRTMLDWARARGFACSIDPIGNIFIRRQGAVKGAAPIVIGSHLDSQMPGGNFDGVYGVLAAFEVLETLEDQRLETQHPVDVVLWMNEEGCRFSPTTMGSAVHAGELPLEVALGRQDRDGVSVRDALSDSLKVLGELTERELGAPASGYLEAHIEQGPLLEAKGLRIGVVTNIQGVRQYEVTVQGEAAHAGTTPKYLRKDALQYGLRLIEELSAQIDSIDDRVRFTVGSLNVFPGVINTIPSRVSFTIDARHPEAPVLEEISALILDACRPTLDGCGVTVERLMHSHPVAFDDLVVRLIRDVADGIATSMDIVSGATHDAKHMAGLCPSGMIFIPCFRGISHNEAENAEADDMIAGANVLLGAVIAFDARPTG